ncbi:DMT family transporter [Goodfellowiella coeruleoviolacea]|uniref:Permease of the drug/metabolite transporter (DMT) superfamily n=1 Tax=Goodfellowiella coeruleoviolacea TaxID=334858 RepID=A0AAE3GDC3_9PSEU|nr:DMT family transporter [Goodfellowiella coeruleoviolacea]MCP2165678.1 Permease of the drug/metabolite transporter (DMT) superfamily [Goodfellowiella coeruleoviolacea]
MTELPVRRSGQPSTTSGSAGVAVAAGALGCLLVGGSVPVTGLLDDYPLLPGLAIRYAVGGLLLLGWLRLTGRGLARPSRRDLLALTAVVGVGMLGFNACALYAQRYAEPGFVAAVLGGSPLVLAVAGPLLARRRPAGRVVLGALLVVTGVVVLSGGGSWHGPGLVLALLTMACEASFTLFAVGVVARLGALAVSVWSCLLAAVGAGVAGTLVGGVVDGGGLVGATAAWRLPDARQAAALAVLGVLVTAVAFGLWYRAVSDLGAGRAGVLVGMMPVGGLVTAVLLGAQQWTGVAALGVGAVALGCALGLRPAQPAPGPATGPTTGPATGRRAPSAARPAPGPTARR